jgi:hypothetical protein
MQWVLVGIFTVIGLVIAGVGLSRVVRRAHLSRHGCLATGTVVAIRQATEDASTVYAPVVAFTTEQGKAEITGQFSCPCFYRVGQQVPVCYAPDEPGRGVILTGRETAIAWALVGGGLVLLGIGAVLSLVE